ncbi:hypothetical protein RvY_11167 [Ramazzottius varieornatus]|uniref:HTH psq-type domain-containing protein n=1 Tax=Ramazzottius varieornatus TaxID=947166 RepID=A0A1D1VP45_RAMVA|nr:hypothetical protein RvY_11167 [Ramazzottius varieornatus]
MQMSTENASHVNGSRLCYDSHDASRRRLVQWRKQKPLAPHFFDMPKEFCKTPFYCQKKLRLIQKTFKKNVTNTLRATGMEVAAHFYLHKVDRRLSASLRKKVANLGALETVKEPLDWKLEPQCIFCVAEASDKKTHAAFPALVNLPNGLSTGRFEIPRMDGSFLLDEDKPTDLSVPKKPRAAKEYNDSPSKPKNNVLCHRQYEIPGEANTDVSVRQKGVVAVKNSPLFGEEKDSRKHSKQHRKTPCREPKSKGKSNLQAGNSVQMTEEKMTAEVSDKTKKGAHTAQDGQRATKKEPARELKRAASKDLTSALKQIINRHISEKSKAERKNDDQDLNGSSNASRNKRGRYRRYDKGDLDEALKAVKNGDMTVHRAGHLFGIPHSTLEYKIKERNMLSKRTPDREKRSSIQVDDHTSSSSPLPPTTATPSTSHTPVTPAIKSESSSPSTALPTLSPIFLQIPSLSPFSWNPSMDSIIPNLSFGFNPTFLPSAFCRNIFGTTPFFTPSPSTSLPFRPWICHTTIKTPPIKTEMASAEVELLGPPKDHLSNDAPLNLIKCSPKSS